MRINLTKKNLINSIYMQIGFSKKISESLLEDTLNHITSNIINSKKLKLSNFGTFTLREKKIISNRNVVLFKASNKLKNYINNINEKI